jgi:hypothetical protein
MAADQSLLQEFDYERPFLYKKQEGAFFSPKRYSYVEASTKVGKTHGCITWLVEKAVLEGRENYNYWWIAPTTAQAKIAMRRIKAAVSSEFYHVNESERYIEFLNGARIWFKSGEKPDNLYGEDVYGAVIDEASRCRYDSFVAIRSTLTATRGQLRMIGNVKGKQNWFYMACRSVERGARENAQYTRISCYDGVEAGILEEDEIEDARSTLTEAEFKELYEAIGQDDADAFIPSDYVQAAIQRGIEDKTAASGALIIGGDPSQGKGDPAAFCLRRGARVIRIEEHKNMDEFGFKAHVLRLFEVEKPAKIFIDGTGFGMTIAKMLWEYDGLRDVVKPFHMAESSLYPDEYLNKRAECWGEGRKWLLSKTEPPALPDDDNLAIELTCIRKKDNLSGKLQLESKEDLKSRGYDSPNMADAWALTFAEPVSFYTAEKIRYPTQRRSRVMA